MASVQVLANELEFQKIFFNRDDSEISGLHYKDGSLLFVADKLSNRNIYKVIFEDDRFYYKSHINLSDLKGHANYLKDVLVNTKRAHKLISPFDLEGLTSCKKTYYLVNEQAREILMVDKKLTKLNIDFLKPFADFGYPLKKIPVNAGFEGIAVDCPNNKLFIAQERSPRALIVIDLKSLKITDFFTTASKNPKQKNLDYADLHFEGGYLYILERNNYNILKMDVSSKKIITSLSFKNLKNIKADELYDTGEPYGLAEGLTMNTNTIYIALDNNKTKISEKAKKLFKVDGQVSSILTFKRPKGF